MNTQPDPIEVKKVRRAAKRQGLTLRKIRRMDPRALDYGRFQLLRDKKVIVDNATFGDIKAYVIYDVSLPE